jgi:hypothetical protein
MWNRGIQPEFDAVPHASSAVEYRSVGFFLLFPTAVSITIVGK